MTSLRFEGGPLHGTTYALVKDQPLPTEYRRKDWTKGHYALQTPDPKSISQFAPHFLWRPSK